MTAIAGTREQLFVLVFKQVIWAKLTWRATAAVLPSGQQVCSTQL